MARNRIYGLFSIVLLIIIFIVPFIYISNFPILTLDDFCRASLDSGNYLNNIKEWYLHHNGRFMNAVFTLIPVYDLTIYRLIIALQFFVLGGLIYRFLISIFKMYGVELGKIEKIFITVLLYIMLISQLPSVYEFFYWYAAITVYLLSFYFFLLFLNYSLEFYFKENTSFFFWGVTILCMVGNLELLMGVTGLILMTLMIVYYYRHKKWNKPIVLLTIVALISSFIVIASPGSNSRMEQFKYAGDFGGAVKISLIRSAELLLEGFFEFPLILFYVFLFLFVYRHLKIKKDIKLIHPIWALVITYSSFVLILFTLFYATGSLGIQSGRIGSFVSSVLLVIITFNIINLAVFTRHNYQNLLLRIRPVYQYSIVIVLLLFIGIDNNNYIGLREDLVKGNLKRFKESYERRLDKINDLGSEDVYLELEEIENTRLLSSGDGDLINRDWVEGCYIKYVNDFYDKKIEKINFK